MAIINTLVEGDLDEAAAVKLVTSAHHVSGVCYGKRGFGYIKNKIQGFNRATKALHCLALVDFMDTGLACPPEVLEQWLPHREPRMLFRIVVRELESWLIADRQNLAGFLSVDTALIPIDPEVLADPKRELINIARHSSRKQIRSAIVPEPNSTAQVGRLYNSEMMRFIKTRWDIQLARANSPSLNHCLLALEAFQ